MFTKNPKIGPNKNFSCEHVQTVPFFGYTDRPLIKNIFWVCWKFSGTSRTQIIRRKLPSNGS
jgi:hypothetical protein